MRYLLDTNVCIAYLRSAHSPVTRRLEQETASDLALCSIVITELRYGALRSSDPTQSFALLATFTNRFTSLPFDDIAAEVAASIRADLALKGTPISPHDILIAAIALANNLVLVTHNTREFSRVTGLQLEGWQMPATP